MNGLNQIRDALIQTLKDGGLQTNAAFSGEAPRVTGPVVSVEVSGVVGKPVAFGGYLGEVYDEETSTVRERYGRRLEAEIQLDARSPEAAGCESAMEQASDALAAGLPAGLRLLEESWDGPVRDGTNRCYLRRGHLKCLAYFTAETAGESGVLLDFALKGVLSS
jgi:hypothetical protein